MDSHQFRQAMSTAVNEIIDYYDTVQDRRVVPNVEPGYLRKLLPDGPPQSGEKWEDIQKDIESKIMPGMAHWQSPHFMAFFPSPSTYPGMLGELYSTALTAPAFNWECSPAVTELEIIVLDWLAKLLNLPSCYLSSSGGGGVIHASASEAIAIVMIAARDRYLDEATSHLEGEEKEVAISYKRGRLVALGSQMSHSSTQKAALVAGTKYRSVPVRGEDRFSMTGDGLRDTIEQCQRDGLEPFYLTVTLGTTTTCAVDRFDEAAQVLKAYPRIWTHVDAAYAGAALICEEYKHLAEQFEAFDSFVMNMSKWLLVNLDASCLFVKSRRELTAALSITPSYLRNKFSDSGQVTDYRDWGIGLSRRFRALKIWFVMRTYGIDGMKSHIWGHIQLGEFFHSLVLSREDLFHVVTKPAFAMVVLSVIPRFQQSNELPSTASASADAITKEVVDTVKSRGEIFLLGVVVGGVYAIRVLCAIPKAEEFYIRRAFDILVHTTEEVLDRHKEPERHQASEKHKPSHKPGKVFKRSKRKHSRRSPRYHSDASSKYTRPPLHKGVTTA